MSKAIADKADVGSIIVRICDEEKSIIEPICQGLGLPIPTHVIDVYKNRRSEYNQIKIWCKIDLFLRKIGVIKPGDMKLSKI